MEIGFTDSAGGGTSVRSFLKATQMDGFLVMHQGQVAAEHYDTGLVAHRPHILMSVSKSFTATLAGLFVDGGRLNPDGLVTDLIPEVKGSAFEGATLQHILDISPRKD
jgi:hypothetical protein